MGRDTHKYNDNIARYIAMQILQNRYNKNLGMPYRQAVRKHARVKRSIDYWLVKAERQGNGEKV